MDLPQFEVSRDASLFRFSAAGVARSSLGHDERTLPMMEALRKEYAI
jgi:hypothetical protein